MTATAQKTPNKVSNDMFPQTVTTETASLNYMKRLTAVAISNILYLRDVFTEDCYGHRKLDNVKLRILTERCPNQNAKKLVQWVKGSFDAMEKKYLKQLILGIYEDESKPNELLEAYSLRFTYEANKVNISVTKGNDKSTSQKLCEETASSELRRSTVKLLRTLIFMIQSMDKLPKDCFVTMKLLYYDDVTPPDYEPPGFMASEFSNFSFNGRTMKVDAGEVVTPFHSFRLRVETNQASFDDLGSDLSDNCQNPKVSQELMDDSNPLVSEESESDEENTSDNIPQKHESQKRGQTDGPSGGWLSVNKAKNKDFSVKSGQKSNESHAIASKMQDMSVNDSSQQIKGLKRKERFDSTQDSMYSTSTGQRCKASEPRDEFSQKGSSKKRRN